MGRRLPHSTSSPPIPNRRSGPEPPSSVSLSGVPRSVRPPGERIRRCTPIVGSLVRTCSIDGLAAADAALFERVPVGDAAAVLVRVDVDGVLAVAAVDGPDRGAVVDVDDVVTGARVQRVAAGVGVHAVVAGARVDDVGAAAGVDRVVAVAAGDAVARGAGVERVVARAAVDPVAAEAADHVVVAVLAEHVVVAGATVDGVVAAGAEDAVVAGLAHQDVRRDAAGDQVAAAGAVDLLGLATPRDQPVRAGRARSAAPRARRRRAGAP